MYAENIHTKLLASLYKLNTLRATADDGRTS